MVIVSLGMRMIYMMGAECRAERIADSRMVCDPLPEPTKEKPEWSFRFLDTTLSLDALPGASAIAKAAFVSTRLSVLKCDGKVSIIRKGCLARCRYALTFGEG